MTAIASPAVVSTTTKRLVDVLTPEQRETQINKLLADLAKATNSSDKKKIRRGLRTRGYYLSRLPKPDEVKAQAEATQAVAAAVAEEIVAKFGDGKGKKGKGKKRA